MMNIINTPSPLHIVENELFKSFDLNVLIKRDDLIHPEISGNKWRKLKLNIERFVQGKYEKLLTFGGAYSNHIIATAKLCQQLNIPSIGIIRGEELNPYSNDTLKRAAEMGMELIFVSRQDYDARYEKYYHNLLRNQYGNVLIVEEGGANYYGMLGVSEVISELEHEPDYLVTAIGTGTTAAGLLFGTERTKVIGIPVFKNGGFISVEIEQHMLNAGLMNEDIVDKMNRLVLATDYGFGGYGRTTPELINFINEVYHESNLIFDQVYTAKMYYAFIDLIKKGKIEKGSEVVLLHTGGIQGLNSILTDLSFDPFKL